MILTVTLNFCVDVTYDVDEIELGETVRVKQVWRHAGGKGMNVARVLHALGHDVVVCGFAGGFSGAAARAELREAGLRDQTVEIADESRITIMVVEPDGRATGFSEPGATISGTEWAALIGRCRTLLQRADAAVFSGSVPPGVPVDCYAQLVAAARAAGVPSLLDADGEELMAGVAAQPEIVKINAAELRGVLPHAGVIEGARQLVSRGVGTAAISRGVEGIVCVGRGGDLEAVPPSELRGNPTGAGDAASAALIAGELSQTPWPERLADAVALSAAAVCTAQAGQFDADVYERLRSEVKAAPLGT